MLSKAQKLPWQKQKPKRFLEKSIPNISTITETENEISG